MGWVGPVVTVIKEAGKRSLPYLKQGGKWASKKAKEGLDAAKKWWKGDKKKKKKDDQCPTGKCDKKPIKRDLKKYEQELKDKKYGDAEKQLDKELRDDGGWSKSPTKDGNGIRYNDGKGGSVILNKGYPGGLKGGGGDAIHAGPYAKISNGGTITRVPLQ
jgi:hypothetical protein